MITKDNVLRTIASLKESTSDVDATLYRVYNFVSILLKENEALESQISQHLQHHVDKKKELEAREDYLQYFIEEIQELRETLSSVRDTRDHWEHLYNEEKREHEETKKHNEHLVRLASERLSEILKLQESRRWADQQYYRLKTNLRIELEKQGFTVLFAQLEHDEIL